MLTYCLKCSTERVDSKVSKTKIGRTTLSSKYGACGSKKSKLVKEHEAKGLLSNLGIKTPLNKVLLSGDILF